MDGFIIINKKENMTSRDVVNIVCKKLHTKKVGHTGTLDPMAKGVLVIAVNKALKLVDELMNEDGQIFCLEINTLPGMTATSLVPQEAQVVGISYDELTQKLVELSLAKYE